MPKISFLTATRGRPAYLAEAIASVEAQTDFDWEHLVCANGSTTLSDGTLNVLAAAAVRTGGRLRFEVVPDLGDLPAVYWNRLARAARGGALSILDDDNRKHPAFVESMTAPLADPSVGAVTCGWRYVGPDGQLSGRGECHANLRTSVDALRDENTVDGGALVVRRSTFFEVGAFDESVRTLEDWHLVQRLVRRCRMVHLPDALLDYRVHSGARTHRMVELGVEGDRVRIRREFA